MVRTGIFISCLFVLGCGSNADKEKSGFEKEAHFSEQFADASLPYEISDTALINKKDTSTIRQSAFITSIPDSIKTKIFGQSSVKYIPLVKLNAGDGIQYLVVKATAEKKTAAIVLVLDEKGSLNAAFPLLVPDADAATSQVSSIDKTYTISRNITKRQPEGENSEGREVYAYDKKTQSFSLVMTDVLDDDLLDLINPIDTFSKKHPLAGDYRQSPKNVVSLRDGRSARELQFFIHFEKENDCKGELKGTAFFTASKTAVYRQGGDPCVMEFHFSQGAVTLKEVEGCGAHRGLKCSFDGKFTRKKGAAVAKPSAKQGRSSRK